MAYSDDRAWSDQFIPAIQEIVGRYLTKVAPIEVDTKQAGDLIMMQTPQGTIACRMRRPQYLSRYPWQITIRSRSIHDRKTEIHKICEGFGDWFFYGFADADNKICRWVLLDLNVFRLYMRFSLSEINFGEQINVDGTTGFAHFDLRSFHGLYEPCKLIIGSSEKIPYRKPTAHNISEKITSFSSLCTVCNRVHLNSQLTFLQHDDFCEERICNNCLTELKTAANNLLNQPITFERWKNVNPDTTQS